MSEKPRTVVNIGDEMADTVLGGELTVTLHEAQLRKLLMVAAMKGYELASKNADEAFRTVLEKRR